MVQYVYYIFSMRHLRRRNVADLEEELVCIALRMKTQNQSAI